MEVNRDQKNEQIDKLKQEFSRASNALLVGFQGLTVEHDGELRRTLRQNNISYQVVKNTLAKRAAKGTPVEGVAESFSGPTAIALSESDPVALARLLTKFAKANAQFTFKAGIVDGRVIEISDVDRIASLPSKEELISKIMFMINSGAQRLTSAMNGVARNLAVVMGQVRDQKES